MPIDEEETEWYNTTNTYTKELDQAVREVREDRKWRRKYMTLQMRYREIDRAAREQEREQGITRAIGMLQRYGVAEEDIITELIREYDMTYEEAEEYVRRHERNLE